MSKAKGELVGYIVITDDEMGLSIPQKLNTPENSRNHETILEPCHKSVTLFESKADAGAAIKRTIDYHKYFNPDEAAFYRQYATAFEARREVKP